MNIKINYKIDDNPYRSPIDNSPGIYDHTLFWRLVKIFGIFMISLIILDAVLLTWGNLSGQSRCINSFDLVVQMLLDDLKKIKAT